MSLLRETSSSRAVRARPERSTRARSVRGAAALILGALASPVAVSAGCAVAGGLDSQTGQPSTGVGSEPTEDSSAHDSSEAGALPREDAQQPSSDAQSGEASGDACSNACADAWTDAGGEADADATPDVADDAGPEAADDAGPDAADDASPDAADVANGDAADDGAGDSSADEASPDAPSDTDASDGDVVQDAGGGDAGADVLPEAALDSGADADAVSDSGCSGPHVAILTPASGATINVSNRNSSTYTFAFSAHVDFCAPMQTVTFDYSGPTGLVGQQEMTFTSYANTFTQQTQVGGPGSSLAAYNGGQNPSNWVFLVTAVDVYNQSTVAQATFTLALHH
jgi:hypothetical protein